MEYFFAPKKISFFGKINLLWRRLLYLKIRKSVFVLICIVLFFVFGVLAVRVYPDLFSFYEVYVINPDGRYSDIGPKEDISIKFSKPIRKDKAEQGFKISPEIPGVIFWQDDFGLGYAQTFVFRPAAYFEPDTKYQIKFDKLESFYGTTKSNQTYLFQTIASPKIKKINPKGPVISTLKPQIEIFLDKESSYFDYLFRLEPDVDIAVNFNPSKTKYTLIPKTQLRQDTEYVLKILKYFYPQQEEKSGKAGEGKLFEIREHIFRTPPPIKIIDIFPKPDSKDVSQKEEIRIVFNRPVDYQSAQEHFFIFPEVLGEIGWEEKTLIFVPKKFLGGKRYEVKIAKGVKSHSDDGFLEEDVVFSFKTKINPHEVIPDVDVVPRILEGKYIDIDVSNQILTIFENGKNLGSFLTSTGKYGMPTPLGRYKILSKSKLAYSRRYNLYMPYWMQFTWAGHGIHELPFWKYRGGKEYKERESHLGTRISHGCVRLGVGPAEEVFRWAEIGTPVIVHE